VRWGIFELSQDGFQHAIDVVDDVAIRESNHAVALARKLCRASCVSLLSLGMLAAVELDHQLSCRAGKVGDASPDRVLPTELPGRAALA
jgi:hypothetical protein